MFFTPPRRQQSLCPSRPIVAPQASITMEGEHSSDINCTMRCGSCNKLGHASEQCTEPGLAQVNGCSKLKSSRSGAPNCKKYVAPARRAKQAPSDDWNVPCCSGFLMLAGVYIASMASIFPENGWTICGIIIAAVGGLSFNVMLLERDYIENNQPSRHNQLKHNKGRLSMVVVIIVLMCMGQFGIFLTLKFDRNWLAVPAILQILLYFKLAQVHRPLRKIGNRCINPLFLILILCGAAVVILVLRTFAGPHNSDNDARAVWETLRFVFLALFLNFIYFLMADYEMSSDWKRSVAKERRKPAKAEALKSPASAAAAATASATPNPAATAAKPIIAPIPKQLTASRTVPCVISSSSVERNHIPMHTSLLMPD